MLDPAKTVVEICGGISNVSEMSGRSETRVRRWGRPKDKGGSDGLIPSDRQVKLLREAISRGIDLRPEHFFPKELVEQINHYDEKRVPSIEDIQEVVSKEAAE